MAYWRNIMVESLKFRPLESGFAEAGFEVIGSDAMSGKTIVKFACKASFHDSTFLF